MRLGGVKDLKQSFGSMKAIYRHLYGAVPVSEYPSDLLQGEKRGECCF